MDMSALFLTETGRLFLEKKEKPLPFYAVWLYNENALLWTTQSIHEIY
jgi:hypothetical protein